MAVKKTAGTSKSKGTAAPKQAAKAKAAAKTSAAAAIPAKAPAKAKAKGAAPKATSAKGKAKAKAKAAPIKLSAAQTELLTKIGGGGETGFLSSKKGELRTIDALQGRKLVKRGAKDKASGGFHYLLSSAGKKHLEAGASGTGSSSAPGGGSL